MWTADKRPLGCKLELGLDVQNPAKRCNFSDIQFSDVVRVPRPADPGPSSILQSSTFGGPLDLVKISQIGHFSDTFRTLFGHFSDIQSWRVVRVPRPADPGPSSILQSSTFGGPLDLVKISQIRSEIRSRAKRCNFSDVQFCRDVQVPRPADIPNLD